MIIGGKIIHHANVSSTNEAASDLINSKSAVEGSVISAGFQSDGKGQRNNKWYSDPFMNLIMSVILKPEMILPEQQFYISKIVSLAILDALGKYSKSFSIKWPNDIYHRDDKIAGILIEHTIIGNKISASIAGIGLNINQSDFPSDLPNPISLFHISGKTHNVQIMQDAVCTNLQKWYTELKEKRFDIIDRSYEDNLYKKGNRIEIRNNGGSFRRDYHGCEQCGAINYFNPAGKEKGFFF